ncbi:hypothetical protein TSUD_21360 [Trifolium subterraneum]|uniref:Uncharacterized protein n=1 Tax=Trifolium subterraneum TaxID=3900 RepID=A0A2Z6NLU5_TRISU|nr:hypothetical protein TSUD_21360 [Trifolium subterraneum]
MQAAKKAVENMKETAANISASAKSGMEKTKATVQEKSEKIAASNPMEKEMATEKKEERINQAEAEKQQAREHNAATKEERINQVEAEKQHAHEHNAATKLSPNADHVTDRCNHNTKAENASGCSAIGDCGSRQPMATDHVSTIPTLGFGNEVAMGSHPIDTNTKAHNLHLGETQQPGSAPAKY